MGKLVLSRRLDESIKISINPNTVDIDALLAALTKGITITLAEIGYVRKRSINPTFN